MYFTCIYRLVHIKDKIGMSVYVTNTHDFCSQSYIGDVSIKDM